jgi:hypothetical protein
MLFTASQGSCGSQPRPPDLVLAATTRRSVAPGDHRQARFHRQARRNVDGGVGERGFNLAKGRGVSVRRTFRPTGPARLCPVPDRISVCDSKIAVETGRDVDLPAPMFHGPAATDRARSSVSSIRQATGQSVRRDQTDAMGARERPGRRRGLLHATCAGLVEATPDITFVAGLRQTAIVAPLVLEWSDDADRLARRVISRDLNVRRRRRGGKYPGGGDVLLLRTPALAEQADQSDAFGIEQLLKASRLRLAGSSMPANGSGPSEDSRCSLAPRT